MGIVAGSNELDFANKLIHVTKTVTFDGGAGSGATGTITLFNCTGRVYLERFTIWCSTTLTDAGNTAQFDVGVASLQAGFISNQLADSAVADRFVHGGTPEAGIGSDDITTDDPDLVSEDIALVVETEAITGGVLTFDIWYRPITDDGALVAA